MTPGKNSKGALTPDDRLQLIFVIGLLALAAMQILVCTIWMNSFAAYLIPSFALPIFCIIAMGKAKTDRTHGHGN